MERVKPKTSLKTPETKIISVNFGARRILSRQLKTESNSVPKEATDHRSTDRRRIDAIISDRFMTHTCTIVEAPLLGCDPVAKEILLLCGMTKDQVSEIRFKPMIQQAWAMRLVSKIMPF